MKIYSENIITMVLDHFFPLIQKLKDEGKSINVIITYMETLGIDKKRQNDVLTKLFPIAVCNEAFLTEADDSESFNSLKKEIDKVDLIGVDNNEDEEDEEDKQKKKSSLGDALKTVTKKTKLVSNDDKLNILQGVLKDAEKLNKIKKILAESSIN